MYFLDLTSWLWQVDEEKSRLPYFVVIRIGSPSVTYELLAFRYGQILWPTLPRARTIPPGARIGIKRNLHQW
jgi:hypothetical protein